MLWLFWYFGVSPATPLPMQCGRNCRQWRKKRSRGARGKETGHQGSRGKAFAEKSMESWDILGYFLGYSVFTFHRGSIWQHWCHWDWNCTDFNINHKCIYMFIMNNWNPFEMFYVCIFLADLYSTHSDLPAEPVPSPCPVHGWFTIRIRSICNTVTHVTLIILLKYQRTCRFISSSSSWWLMNMIVTYCD